MPSRQVEPESPAEKLLLQPIGPRVSRLAGVACLLIGLALALVFVWFLIAVLGRGTAAIGPIVFLAVVAGLSGLMLSVGYRLWATRPNRYGSLLSPAVWILLALVFLSASVAGLVLSFVSRDYRYLDGVIGAMLLSLLSYGAASHFRRKARRFGSP